MSSCKPTFNITDTLKLYTQLGTLVGHSGILVSMVQTHACSPGVSKKLLCHRLTGGYRHRRSASGDATAGVSRIRALREVRRGGRTRRSSRGWHWYVGCFFLVDFIGLLIPIDWAGKHSHFSVSTPSAKSWVGDLTCKP